jgi:hypothetical protein
VTLEPFRPLAAGRRRRSIHCRVRSTRIADLIGTTTGYDKVAVHRAKKVAARGAKLIKEAQPMAAHSERRGLAGPSSSRSR